MAEVWKVGQPCKDFCDCYDGPCYNIYLEGGQDVTNPCAGLSKDDAEFIVNCKNKLAGADARELLLDIIQALGGNREFWDTADGCQETLARALAVLRGSVGAK